MHYTLTSGKRQVVITSRCPVCNAVKSHGVARAKSGYNLTYSELCCTPEHAKEWRDRVMALFTEERYGVLIEVYRKRDVDDYLHNDLAIAPTLPDVMVDMLWEGE